MFYHDIFYNIRHLTLEQKKQLCIDAKEKSFDWRVDKLVSLARQQIDMSFEDIMSKLDEKCHFVFINRRGDEQWKGKEYFPHTWCLETGFCTLSGADYYLRIYMKDKEKDFFIKKYNLKEM